MKRYFPKSLSRLYLLLKKDELEGIDEEISRDLNLLEKSASGLEKKITLDTSSRPTVYQKKGLIIVDPYYGKKPTLH
ncbi:MAG: hypothetical protein V1914_03720 [archaeon]